MVLGVAVLRKSLLFVLLVTLIGCDGSSEHVAIDDKEAFRKALVEKALNDDTRKAGEAYVDQFSQRQDVIVSDSGLHYRVIEQGSGRQPRLDEIVEVEYEGRLVTGERFDATDKGSTATFPLNQVIKGWREGLSKMSEGARWELVIPADLAYGARSPTPAIPPNSTLIFDVKLVSIIESGTKEK